MMKRVVPLFFVGGLLSAALFALVGPGCGPSHTGCQTDMDCKGDRVCDFATGACVSPGGGGTVDGGPVDDGGVGDGGLTDGGDTDGGDDGGIPDAGPPKICRDDPEVCLPDRYNDDPMGDYPTTSYPKLNLRSNGTIVQANHDGSIIQASGWSEGTQHDYWLMNAGGGSFPQDAFGGSGLRVGRMYVVLDENDQPVGDPILEAAPDASEFSPFLQVFEVSTVAGYTPDGLKSYTSLIKAIDDKQTGVLVHGTNTVLVYLPVDKTVDIENNADAPEYPVLEELWYDSHKVYAYRIFGGKSDGSVPLELLSTDPDHTPPTPRLSEAWQFTLESGAPCPSSSSLYLTTLGNAAYVPLHTLHITTAAEASCAAIPHDATEVKARVDSGTYTVNEDVVVLRPQTP